MKSKIIKPEVKQLDIKGRIFNCELINKRILKGNTLRIGNATAITYLVKGIKK